MINGQIPEYVPYYEAGKWSCGVSALRPAPSPDGSYVNHFGVEYVGVEVVGGASLPKPGVFILEDIRKWRDVIKRPAIVDQIDWAATAKKDLENRDPELLRIGSGCLVGGYFQPLVSYMGFENALIACLEEPDEVKALLDFLLQINLELIPKYLHYYKPDIFSFGDDIAHERSTFISEDVFQDIFEPVWRATVAPAKEAGLPAHHHNCGKFEAFVPYIVDMGFNAWEPAQSANDVMGIKQKYAGKFAVETGVFTREIQALPEATEESIRAEVRRFMDLYAPGGGYAFIGSVSGPPGDELTAQRNKWLRDEYEQNKFKYYT
ncbi:MAG: hypothetical protein FWF83_01820 [Clostridiales bacterium]|nr:hypothetical protein [Clostridiales bacterium]